MPSMARAHIRKKRTFVAAWSAIAVAFVLVFNFGKPTFGTFHGPVSGTRVSHFHNHGHEVSGNHHGHLPHTHKHEHRDGTTHEHQYHDEHCVKVNSNTTIVCQQVSYVVPTGIWSPVLPNSTIPNFAFSAHSAELLRPPILA